MSLDDRPKLFSKNDLRTPPDRPHHVGLFLTPRHVGPGMDTEGLIWLAQDAQTRRGAMPQGGWFGHATAEDLTILARAGLSGDRDRLLVACRQYAYDAAIRLGRKDQGAEDSAQDAAMAVLRLLPADPPEIKPETLGGLVRVLVLRNAHAAARRRLHEASAAEQMAVPRESPDVATEAESAERARRILEVVARLPAQFRRLIESRYWDDMSCEQIARQIGTSRMSIMRLLEQAEAWLRGQLGDTDGTCGEPDCVGGPGPSRS